MNLTGKRPTFRKQKAESNPYRILVLLVLLIISVFILRSIEQGEIQPPFLPTPIPTRTAHSYALEGETHFKAGNLNESISAYQQAVQVDPNDAEIWAELARIQTYSSALLTTDADKKARLDDAIEAIDIAVELAPENSTVHAIRAFVLDWYSNPSIAGEESDDTLNDAEQEAVLAIQLDNQNTLALSYYAEILVDRQALLQAEQYSNQALERDPSLMDVHRIHALVRESLGYYRDAIDEYNAALEITPNLTFLYINIGVNYRQLKEYDMALEYFAKAATINEQLDIQDPLPYIAISKTYSQMGEFFIASRNVMKALQFKPEDPDIYATLGVVYFKSRNYEGAIPAFKCALEGCNPVESCEVRQCLDENDPAIEITGMPLSPSTVVYYYTYGSVLAGMHQPFNNHCEKAMEILSLVRKDFYDEPIVMDIVEASEQICISFGFNR